MHRVATLHAAAARAGLAHVPNRRARRAGAESQYNGLVTMPLGEELAQRER